MSVFDRNDAESREHYFNWRKITCDPNSKLILSVERQRTGLNDRAQVENLQAILQRLGYYSGRIDRIYAEQTDNAVRQFQSGYRLSSDGDVGQNIWSALCTQLRR